MEKKHYKRWTHEQYRSFIKKWQAANSIQEVADAHGLTINQAYIRSAFLRRKGVPLKYMTTGKTIDYQDLTKLAEKSN